MFGRLSISFCFNDRLYNRPVRKLAIFSILLIISCFSAFIYSPVTEANCIPPPEGVVGWWPGDGDTHDAQRGNPGVLRDGVVYSPGFVDQGFQFNGINSYVEIPNAPDLEDVQEDSFTVEAWYKPFSRPTGSGTDNNAHHGILRDPGDFCCPFEI